MCQNDERIARTQLAEEQENRLQKESLLKTKEVEIKTLTEERKQIENSI